jgi:glycosyltransferase involved in cell wall biosynthesis
MTGRTRWRNILEFCRRTLLPHYQGVAARHENTASSGRTIGGANMIQNQTSLLEQSLGTEAEHRLKPPTVSVVVIFLNAEKFLTESIESVLSQTLTDWELLLVDDGSTDRSTAIAQAYAEGLPEKVVYLEHDGHQNKGMSASRNLGINRSRGEFIALLDADDIWLPDKLHKQVSRIRQYPEVGLIANSALYWYADGIRKPQPMTLSPGVLPAGSWIPKILESDNNAACPSSVLIRTALLKELGGFEEAFQGPLMVFEDQITWFKISLASAVYYDPENLILYRIHSESCCMSVPPDNQLSARIVLYSRLTELLNKKKNACARQKTIRAMTRTRLCQLLLQSQRQHLGRAPVATANRWVRRYVFLLGPFFSTMLSIGIVSNGLATRLVDRAFVATYVAYHSGFLKLLRVLPQHVLKTARRLLPQRARLPVRRVIRPARLLQARLRLASGVRPLSERWATDRGLPIHRYYLAQFLREFRSDVRGHCLEFQDDTYTMATGGDAVAKLDILHIDHSNPRATIVADLTRPNDIPGEVFDCIVCTHVLHVVADLDKAISELHRILKPGGALLVAVPQLSMCDPESHELWRFTPEGLCLLLAKVFGRENVLLRAYGNSLTSACEIRGLASDELSPSVLDDHDPRFAIEVCARAVKSLVKPVAI